jgi:hypothetical protein
VRAKTSAFFGCGPVPHRVFVLGNAGLASTDQKLILDGAMGIECTSAACEAFVLRPDKAVTKIRVRRAKISG